MSSFDLTDAEQNILELGIEHSFDTKFLMDKLVITESTLRCHLKTIYQKLHVTNKADAAVKYMKAKQKEQTIHEQKYQDEVLGRNDYFRRSTNSKN